MRWTLCDFNDDTLDGTIDLTNGGATANKLTIQGNYVQTATGNLVVGITPSANDLLAVSGTASLADAVKFVYAPGTYQAGTKTFLTATGGVTGTFASSSSVNTPSGFTPTLTYTANTDTPFTSAVRVTSFTPSTRGRPYFTYRRPFTVMGSLLMYHVAPAA